MKMNLQKNKKKDNIQDIVYYFCKFVSNPFYEFLWHLVNANG